MAKKIIDKIVDFVFRQFTKCERLEFHFAQKCGFTGSVSADLIGSFILERHPAIVLAQKTKTKTRQVHFIQSKQLQILTCFFFHRRCFC